MDMIKIIQECIEWGQGLPIPVKIILSALLATTCAYAIYVLFQWPSKDRAYYELKSTEGAVFTGVESIIKMRKIVEERRLVTVVVLVEMKDGKKVKGVLGGRSESQEAILFIVDRESGGIEHCSSKDISSVTIVSVNKRPGN